MFQFFDHSAHKPVILSFHIWYLVIVLALSLVLVKST